MMSIESAALTMNVDGTTRELTLVDTAGGMSGGRMDRDYTVIPPKFANADAFLVTYGIDRPYSLMSASRKWIPMIRQHYKGKGSLPPVFLVGLKMELRDVPIPEGGRDPIKFEAAENLANTARVDGHYECSSKTGEGLTELLEKAVREVDEAREAKKTAPPVQVKAKKVKPAAKAGDEDLVDEQDDDLDSIEERLGAFKYEDLVPAAKPKPAAKPGVLAALKAIF